MNVIDIIALAKQGYKPNDIRELMELAKEQSKVEETEVSKEEVVTEEVTTEEVTTEEVATEEDDAEVVENKPDDKDLIIEKLSKELKELQNKAIRQSLPIEPDNSEKLKDIFRDFM